MAALNLTWITPDLAIGGRLSDAEARRLSTDEAVGAVIDLRSEAVDEAAILERQGIAFLHLPTDDHAALVDARQRLIKTDALDHCVAHDLVGCQDIAWDVAGAAFEFDLVRNEAERLRLAVARRAGEPCPASLVGFFRIAYAAFTIGRLTLARQREAGAEAARLDRAIARATAVLDRSLG